MNSVRSGTYGICKRAKVNEKITATAERAGYHSIVADV